MMLLSTILGIKNQEFQFQSEIKYIIGLFCTQSIGLKMERISPALPVPTGGVLKHFETVKIKIS